MGIFNWVRSRLTTEQRAITDGWYSDTYQLFDGIGMSDIEGISVTPQTALTATAVYSAVSIISGAIATLPIHVLDSKTNKKVEGHPVNKLFRSPNEYMTWSDYAESYFLNLLTTGNGYGWAQRDSFFDPIAIYPLKSLNTAPRRQRGRLAYISTADGKASTLPIESVIHTKNLSWNGVEGISPLVAGEGAVGLTLALDRFARRFFDNGANVGNVIELPPMAPDALEEFKRRWEKDYQGLRNAHKTAAAPGLKIHKAGYAPRESQAIESRKHQLAEVSRVYQIPPHKLGDLEKSSFSNIEEQGLDFAVGTLRRWIVKFEEAHERILLREDERDKVKIRINVGAIVRGSLKNQIEALSKATGGAPVMTQNEARDHLGLPPSKGGDVLLQNLNQAPAEAKRSRALLGSIADNFATKEANAIRRAAKKHNTPEAFEDWAGEFYGSHAEKLTQATEGAGVSRRAVDRVCDESKGLLIEAFKSDQIEARIMTIESETAAHIADRLAADMREGEGHNDTENRAA